MALLIHLTDRSGDHVGPRLLVDAKPAIGESIVFTNRKRETTSVKIIDIQHHAHQQQVDRNSDVRVYVLLDVDGEGM